MGGHLNWQMPLGGALRGTLPNPTLASGSGGGALELVENHEFVANATSYSFTGLDGDTDEIYLLVWRLLKNTGAAIDVDVHPNGITSNQKTHGRYDGSGGAGTYDTTTLNLYDSGSATSGDVQHGETWILAKTGIRRTGRTNQTSIPLGSTDPYLVDSAFVWNEIVTNITSLDIVSSVASGIGAGSFVALYRLKKT